MADTGPAPKPGKQSISRSRRRLFALVLFLSLIAFQELLVRLVFPVPESTRFNRIRFQLLAESDPRFRPLMKRGLVYDKLLFESSPDGWRHVHELNRFGFRERDFSIQPSVVKKRVLVVGDSVTEGQGAAYNQTIPAQLGKQLGQQAEVLNLGVVAATMDKVTQLACEATALLKPDTLVVVMYANDTPAPPVPQAANLRDLNFMATKFQQDVEASRPARLYWPRLAVIIQKLAAGEPVYSRFFAKTISYFAPTPDATNPFKAGSAPMPGLKPELEEAMRAGRLNPWLVQQSEAMPGMIRHDFNLGGSPELHLRAIQQACRQMGVKLVLAYVPFHATVHARYAQPLIDLKMPKDVAEALSVDPAYKAQAVQLKSICDKIQIPFVDTTGPLTAQENQGKPQFWAYDSHPRPEGYATIADAIAQALKR